MRIYFSFEPFQKKKKLTAYTETYNTLNKREWGVCHTGNFEHQAILFPVLLLILMHLLFSLSTSINNENAFIYGMVAS